MEFSINRWREIYDEVHRLSKFVSDSKPDCWGNPPKLDTAKCDILEAEKEIELLLKDNDRYLDQCKIRPHERLWNYDRYNETTWASSEKFAYRDKISKNRYMRVKI